VCLDLDKYRHRYLAEVQYPVDRRFDLASLVGRIAIYVRAYRPVPGALAAARGHRRQLSRRANRQKHQSTGHVHTKFPACFQAQPDILR